MSSEFTFFVGALLGGFLVYIVMCIYADRIVKATKNQDSSEKKEDPADFWKPDPDDEYWGDE